jgi:hypothetical protein
MFGGELRVSLALRERLGRLDETAAAVGIFLEVHVLIPRPIPDALGGIETWLNSRFVMPELVAGIQDFLAVMPALVTGIPDFLAVMPALVARIPLRRALGSSRWPEQVRP